MVSSGSIEMEHFSKMSLAENTTKAINSAQLYLSEFQVKQFQKESKIDFNLF